MYCQETKVPMIRAGVLKDSLRIGCTILVLLDRDVELVLHELKDVDLLDGNLVELVLHELNDVDLLEVNLSGKLLSGKLLSGRTS